MSSVITPLSVWLKDGPGHTPPLPLLPVYFILRVYLLQSEDGSSRNHRSSPSKDVYWWIKSGRGEGENEDDLLETQSTDYLPWSPARVETLGSFTLFVFVERTSSETDKSRMGLRQARTPLKLRDCVYTDLYYQELLCTSVQKSDSREHLQLLTTCKDTS